jgi:hypothetical protein
VDDAGGGAVVACDTEKPALLLEVIDLYELAGDAERYSAFLDGGDDFLA